MTSDLSPPGRNGTVLCEGGRKIKILLADGHHMVRQGIRKLIEDESDFEVVEEADNGCDAVRLANVLKPDVVVMEARLPGLDSVSVIKRLNVGENSRSVLILTTLEDEGRTLELIKAGANGCIFKTAAGHDLVQTIRMIRAGQFVCDPAVERKLLKHVNQVDPLALDSEEPLTHRELEVLKLAAKGWSNQDIADHLGLTVGTIKGYLGHVFNKMRVSSRTEAVMEGLKCGLISLAEE